LKTSRLVTLVEEQTSGTLAERTPEIGTYVLKATPTTALAPQIKVDDFVGDVAARSGLSGLEIAEDVTMVACPDLMSAYLAGKIDKDGVKAVQTAMIAHCELLGNRMAILDPLPGLSPQEMKQWREQTNFDSMFA